MRNAWLGILLAALGSLAVYELCWIPTTCNREEKAFTVQSELAQRFAGSFRGALTARNILDRYGHMGRACPGHKNVFMLIGANEILRSRNEAAVAAYQHALSLGPRPEIYAGLASALYRSGRQQEAFENVAAVVAADPEYAGSYFQDDPVLADHATNLAAGHRDPAH